MKVGMAMNMLYEHGRPDVAVVHEHFQLGDLVEPLGFDSIWALEHHFTGYAMSPAPTQLLAYYAGRTKRIVLFDTVIARCRLIRPFTSAPSFVKRFCVSGNFR